MISVWNILEQIYQITNEINFPPGSSQNIKLLLQKLEKAFLNYQNLKQKNNRGDKNAKMLKNLNSK